MTEQDTFTLEDENSKFWHKVIWDKLEDWNGDFKLKLKYNSDMFSIHTHRWSIKIMNFIETQNADRYGKIYLPETNNWVSYRELLEAVTIPRKVE